MLKHFLNRFYRIYSAGDVGQTNFENYVKLNGVFRIFKSAFYMEDNPIHFEMRLGTSGSQWVLRCHLIVRRNSFSFQCYLTR